MTVQRLKLAGVAIGCLAFLAAAPGVALAASKCDAGITKAAGKKEGCLCGVYAKSQAKNLTPDPAKIQKCKDKFSASCAKAQSAADCVFQTASCASKETDVDNDAGSLCNPSAPTQASKCDGGVTKAAGKKVSCKCGVYAKSYAKDITADPAKLQKCTDKFTAKCLKADSAADCSVQTGSCSSIETAADGDVTSLCIGVAPTTTTTTTGSTTTTTGGVCCGINPTKLNFTTSTGTGNCGAVQLSNGSVSKNLACGGLFTGGGSNTVPLPYAVPDMGSSLTKVSSCSGTSLTLANLTSAQTGSNRDCTSVGCLFGPPLPIPNPGSTPTSVCVINTVTTNASGAADCSTGASSLNLPLNSEIFLDGDLFPAAPGIQVCPVCNKTCNAGSNLNGPCNSDADCPSAGAGSCAGSNKCHGGGNDGLACTPADSVIGTLGDFPTTHDCPPPVAMDIGGLPIAFALTTGSTMKTGQTISGQNNVFCGYCRDNGGGSSAGTGCFEGDPSPACPHNNGNSSCTGNMMPVNCCTGPGTGTCFGVCTAAGVPFPCCTGVGTGTCDPQAVKACTSAATCTDGNGAWPDCQQRNPGAFGPAGGGGHTITETGAPAGDMTDGLGHASKLVSIFCIPPTFNTSVDNTGDLPGPGGVSLPGTAQLLP